ncbi:hypothetical protein [Arthrobacter sp. 9AX]|uniref:hypothetical protein n=1 Tax=Arthrobacter sp. 9AX TaxID=2653131 RepID=UPI0013572845|nr:hypothetical protein [Arthrobacter sp. 9AX]
MAVRLYEMVAAPYLTSRDTSLLTPELAVALARTAELAEQDGSYRFAAERFNEASRVFTAIAATAARQGNQKASKMAEAEADETQQRAKRAASEQSRLQEKQDRMLAQEGQLKARQFEDFARHLGRS